MESLATYDVAVVGAGPYGLSAAAHLLGRGLKVAVFGKPLGFWREHMPKGMLLRSHWWATNLSDPHDEYGFKRFFKESRHRECYPLPIEAFIDYGLWFQSRAVPGVDETLVTSLERQGGRFLLTLEDGRQVRSAAVVMALGPHGYAHRPGSFAQLPEELASHTCEHADFAHFKGRRVAVVGGGQSATESAALLHETGASVHLISRRPIVWLAPDRENRRALLEKIWAPSNGLAPGWQNWMLENMPYLFHRLPQRRKDLCNAAWGAAAAAWLKDRLIGKVDLHEGQALIDAKAADGHVEATLSDGRNLKVDHLLLATGYKVDIDRLNMLHPSLRSEIKTEKGAPVLNRWFESSLPGLYFVGLTSVRSFGPLFRFVAGCGATARRVASSFARSPAPNRDASAARRGVHA